MSKIEKANLSNAREAAGYREKYAMDHGQRIVFFQNGKEFWKFSYSDTDEYQDANGATWDVKENKWIA